MAKHGGSFFGGGVSDPNMARQLLLEQARAQAMAGIPQGGSGTGGASFLPPGSVAAAGGQGAGAGMALGQALAQEGVPGFQVDPAIRKAEALQEIQQTVLERARGLGISEQTDPERFATIAAQEFITRGMAGEAFQVMEQGREMELERRRVEATEGQVRVSLMAALKKDKTASAGSAVGKILGDLRDAEDRLAADPTDERAIREIASHKTNLFNALQDKRSPETQIVMPVIKKIIGGQDLDEGELRALSAWVLFQMQKGNPVAVEMVKALGGAAVVDPIIAALRGATGKSTPGKEGGHAGRLKRRSKRRFILK